ncbi:MAG TPA: LPS export ABC transporter permease LptF [Deltaproteobacteria bacterium]|nr:LPS export ABC transporter permease LptF [Deltaproteobacteria bacterium]
MPRLISVYIFKEITASFVLCVVVLTLTGLLSKVLKIIDLAVNHGIGLKFIGLFIVSLLPTFLIYVLPISFLVAVMTAFTRLSSDSEITAMKASGLSLVTLTRPVFAFAVIVSAMTLFFTLYGFPWGNHNIKKLLFEVARTKTSAAIEEKTFYDRFKGVVLYVDRIGADGMEGIFILEERLGRGKNLIFAESGAFVPSPEDLSLYMTLRNGTIHGRDEESGTYHMVGFDTYTVELEVPGGGSMSGRANRELYLTDFLERIDEVAARGESTAPYVIDLHKRFTLPVSIFIFTFLGVPLGIQKVRSARLTGFAAAFVLVFIYYVLSTSLEALGEYEHIPPLLAIWGSTVILFPAGLYVFYRAAKDSPLGVTDFLESLGSTLAERLALRGGAGAGEP